MGGGDMITLPVRKIRELGSFQLLKDVSADFTHSFQFVGRSVQATDPREEPDAHNWIA